MKTKRAQLVKAGLPANSIQTRLSDDESCPYCRSSLNATSSMNGEKTPRSGDLALCSYCGALLVFDDQLHQNPLNDSQLNALTLQERIDIAEAQRIITAAREVK